MNDFLFVLGIAGLITSTIYAALAVWGAMRFARRRRVCFEGGFHPPVSLLKPLHGLEPELEARLESFFRQEYSHFEILFCARDWRDPGLRIAQRVAARHPHIPAKFLISGNPPDGNAKVWSLERMQEVAEHEIFVVSDSDVSVSPNYLKEIVAPFAEEEVGLVTCLYRGVSGSGSSGGGSLWSRLEAAGMSVEMTSGVLVAESLEGMKFALGPTMVVRRRCLEHLGGFGILRPYHADDFMLGSMVAEGGSKVVLSTHVVEHHVLNASFLSSTRHQLRWMKSTRFSRPKGHLGTALTFSMPYALLCACLALAERRPFLAAALFVWGWTTRVCLAGVVAGAVVKDTRLAQTTLLFPLRDLVGFFHWIASYRSNDVIWRGEVYEIQEDGTMRSGSKPVGREPTPALTS